MFIKNFRVSFNYKNDLIEFQLCNTILWTLLLCNKSFYVILDCYNQISLSNSNHNV